MRFCLWVANNADSPEHEFLHGEFILLYYQYSEAQITNFL